MYKYKFLFKTSIYTNIGLNKTFDKKTQIFKNVFPLKNLIIFYGFRTCSWIIIKQFKDITEISNLQEKKVTSPKLKLSRKRNTTKNGNTFGRQISQNFVVVVILSVERIQSSGLASSLRVYQITKGKDKSKIYVLTRKRVFNVYTINVKKKLSEKKG